MATSIIVDGPIRANNYLYTRCQTDWRIIERLLAPLFSIFWGGAVEGSRVPIIYSPPPRRVRTAQGVRRPTFFIIRIFGSSIRLGLGI